MTLSPFSFIIFVTKLQTKCPAQFFFSPRLRCACLCGLGRRGCVTFPVIVRLSAAVAAARACAVVMGLHLQQRSPNERAT
jgi:hypothetical protein